MNTLKNDRYLRVLLNQSVDMTPVWIMRQCGRYLPEYKILRNKIGNFISLYKNAELACEVTLQPLRRYSLDAAIIFSDILTIPDAMGLGLYFKDNQDPKFSNPITSFSDIDKLPIPDPEQELKYVMDTVRASVSQLKGQVPLIGFSGSPWTLAIYMIEGGTSKNFAKIKKIIYTDPKILHLLLNKLSESIILYLNAQIKAGVHAIMIFDTYGGVLTKHDYQEFSLYYMHKIIDNIIYKKNDCRVPITIFTKGGGQWLELIIETGCDALGIDWTIDIADAVRRVGDKVVLQGNMEPAVLYAAPKRIEEEVTDIIKKVVQSKGHIFNLGHGIYPDTPINNVKFFIETVHRVSRIYH